MTGDLGSACPFGLSRDWNTSTPIGKAWTVHDHQARLGGQRGRCQGKRPRLASCRPRNVGTQRGGHDRWRPRQAHPRQPARPANLSRASGGSCTVHAGDGPVGDSPGRRAIKRWSEVIAEKYRSRNQRWIGGIGIHTPPDGRVLPAGGFQCDVPPIAGAPTGDAGPPGGPPTLPMTGHGRRRPTDPFRVVADFAAKQAGGHVPQLVRRVWTGLTPGGLRQDENLFHGRCEGGTSSQDHSHWGRWAGQAFGQIAARDPPRPRGAGVSVARGRGPGGKVEGVGGPGRVVVVKVPWRRTSRLRAGRLIGCWPVRRQGRSLIRRGAGLRSGPRTR